MLMLHSGERNEEVRQLHIFATMVSWHGKEKSVPLEFNGTENVEKFNSSIWQTRAVQTLSGGCC